MIDRVIRKLSLELLKLRIKPQNTLASVIDLPAVRKRQEQAMSDLKHAYQDYVTNISRPDMAVSVELAAFSNAIFEERKAVKILDLGSGFSSLVSRKFAQRTFASCWSVDDDVAWLQKTVDYLHHNQLQTGQCLLLDDFVRSGEGGFDIVLLDLNFVEVRRHFIRLAAERTRMGGLILFDDVHKPEYKYEVLKQCRALPVSLYDVREFTLDQYGRYALLGVKN